MYFRMHRAVYNHVGYYSRLLWILFLLLEDCNFNVHSQDFVLFLFDDHTKKAYL